MKKGVFTVMHHLMPDEGALSLHSSANEGREHGDTTLFFGFSGTGKTTCLKHLINILTSDKDSKDKVDTRIRVTEEPHCIFVNCMALKNTSSVYSTIANQILPIVGSLDIGSSPDSHKKALESVIVGKNTEKKILLVLDEMDQLDSKFHEVLYSLFEWPYLRNSKLVLVGIANSLDLTDRILPRLKVSIVPPHLTSPWGLYILKHIYCVGVIIF